MQSLPIFVDLDGRRCVVIGGGAIAARKVEALVRAGARVTVIAPQISREIEDLAAGTGAVELWRRAYAGGDLAGSWLAFAATGDPAVQDQVAREAARERIWLNAVDEPERCSFTMPAIAERGPIVVAVATGGASPALAAAVRDEVAARLGPEYAAAAAHLAALRARYAPGPARQRAFARLVEEGLVDAFRARDSARIEALTHAACDGLVERDTARTSTPPEAADAQARAS
jgi:siroheme synthase-like protein